MAGDPLDRLFARFRKEGDVASLGEIFDQVAPELLRVARHVVPRSLEPHDLVQATFLIAIERAASYDPSRPVKAWLLGILTKEAAFERRKGARVVEPDRLEPRHPRVPDERVSDRELRAAVGAALESLPPKYRDVVAPAILDGASPRDIARRNGVRAGTVRVQLHRGLRMLREALPAGFALGAAVSASTGLAEARTRVLIHAAGRAPALVGPGVALIAWVASRWQLAAAGVLAAGVVWVALERREPARTAEGGVAGSVERAQRGTALPAGAASSRRGVAPVPAAGMTGVAESGATAEHFLVGRVLGLDRRASAFASIALRIDGLEPFRTRADANGAFRLRVGLSPEISAVGSLTAVGPQGQAEVTKLGLTPGGGRERYLGTLVLGEAVDVPVHVVDSGGARVPGAAVQAYSRGLVVAQAIADESGRAVLRGLPHEELAFTARSAGGAGAIAGAAVRRPARGVTVRLGAGTAPAPPAPPERSATPAEGREIVLRFHSGGRAVWRLGDARFLCASLPAEVAPAGDGDVSVRVRGEPGTEVLLELELAGFVPTSTRVLLTDGPLPAIVDLELDSLASLVASVPRAPDARVVVELQGWHAGIGSWGPTQLDWGGLTVPNTDAGEFRFDGLLPGSYRVRDRLTGLCSPPVEVGPGERLAAARLDLTVLRRVHGRVVVPSPEDLRLVRILVEARDVDYAVNRRATNQRYQWDVAPDHDGRFSVRVPGDRPVILRAVHPLLVPASGAGAVGLSDLGWPDRELSFELVRGPELRIPLPDLEHSVAPGRFRALLYPAGETGEPSGEPLASFHPLVEDGVARFAGPAPGRWTLWVDPGPDMGVRPAILRDILVGSSTTLLGPLPMEAGSSIRFLLEGEHEGFLTAFARSHGQPDYTRTAAAREDGTLVLGGLGPGRFTVQVGGPESLGPLLVTEVELDGLRDLELAVRAP